MKENSKVESVNKQNWERQPIRALGTSCCWGVCVSGVVTRSCESLFDVSVAAEASRLLSGGFSLNFRDFFLIFIF